VLFGLGLPEWLTIILLAASVPLTLKMMSRASAAYERKAAEREAAAEAANSPTGEAGSEGLDPEERVD
jgi:hypothetical protein